MNNKEKYFINSSFSGEVITNHPMKSHCTFKSGGPAEIYLVPHTVDDIILVRQLCRENSLPLFVLGGGANILVSDRGIPGVTLSLEHFDSIQKEGHLITAGAGLAVNNLVDFSIKSSLAGLEFLNRLPGSVGGALFMNARCYGSEIADVLSWAEIIDEDDSVKRVPISSEQWEYKISPFQKEGIIILKAAFELKRGHTHEMKAKAKEIGKDRIKKGHFKAPSAGSTFKNNRQFGKPSGQLIDECGFKGLTLGGASVAPWHGNILINNNEATSQEISDLIDRVQKGVEEKTGFKMEPEVLRVGLWD